MVSDYPVRAEVSSDLTTVPKIPENGSPGFSSAGDYTRSIPEDTGRGMPVGAPVVARDPDADTLTYELAAAAAADTTGTTGDVGFFSIDRANGQIARWRRRLDYDTDSDGYTFLVRAIDPSGETAEVEVTVNVTDANDAPQ